MVSKVLEFLKKASQEKRKQSLEKQKPRPLPVSRYRPPDEAEDAGGRRMIVQQDMQDKSLAKGEKCATMKTGRQSNEISPIDPN